nr:hypothetical protein Iba_chr11cCG12190 [Ipomoea batatas]
MNTTAGTSMSVPYKWAAALCSKQLTQMEPGADQVCTMTRSTLTTPIPAIRDQKRNFLNRWSCSAMSTPFQGPFPGLLPPLLSPVRKSRVSPKQGTHHVGLQDLVRGSIEAPPSEFGTVLSFDIEDTASILQSTRKAFGYKHLELQQLHEHEHRAFLKQPTRAGPGATTAVTVRFGNIDEANHEDVGTN